MSGINGINVSLLLPLPLASSLHEKGKPISKRTRTVEESDTHRPTMNFELTQARHDHPRPRTMSNRGTPTSRACLRVSHRSNSKIHGS